MIPKTCKREWRNLRFNHSATIVNSARIGLQICIEKTMIYCFQNFLDFLWHRWRFFPEGMSKERRVKTLVVYDLCFEHICSQGFLKIIIIKIIVWPILFVRSDFYLEMAIWKTSCHWPCHMSYYRILFFNFILVHECSKL